MSVNRVVYTGTAYFGEGIREKIAAEAAKRGFKTAFLVTDEAIIKCGITAKVEAVLKKSGISYSMYADIKPNPTIENVLSCLNDYKKAKSDFILAVGGGSVIDTAKAVSVIAANPQNEDVISLEGADKSANTALPLIAVPTTAGTGSETTMDYVITNAKQRRKMACMDSKAVPVAAILDTDIMASMPLKLTAATAMDALTHAVESYLSKGAFSFTEGLSLKAVSLIAENLTKLIEQPEDKAARKEIAVAQYMAGMSFTNAGLGIVHSMAHPLSAFYDIPHGIANALLLPFALEFNADACRDKIISLAGAFNPSFSGDYSAALSCCLDTINKINSAFGLPRRLRDTAVKESDLDILVQSAFEDVSTADNIKDVSPEIIKKLYIKAM